MEADFNLDRKEYPKQAYKMSYAFPGIASQLEQFAAQAR
jgi:hypothetical protein